MTTVYLIDAYAMIYRAYFAFMRAPRVNSQGINTSPIFGFVSMFNDMVLKRQPTHVAVAFDVHGPTFRHKLYEQYKAQREAQPEDISVAVPYIQRFIEAMGIAQIECPGYEADDIVGTLAHRFASQGAETIMVTPDKDYAQLVGPNISMLRPVTGGEPELMDAEAVKAKYGIESPTQVIDMLGLWGDTSDNIPGCPGVGEKRAAELIGNYGSIDGIYANIDKVKGKLRDKLLENRDQVILSRTLATIVTDAPVAQHLADVEGPKPDWGKVEDLFRELEIRNMTQRLRAALGLEVPVVNETTKRVAQPQQPSLFDAVGLDGGEAAQSVGAGQGNSESGVDAKPDMGTNIGDNVENGTNPSTEFDTLATTEHRYGIATTDEELDQLCQTLMEASHLSFDTETTSLSAVSANIVGMSVATESGVAWYVPLPQDKALATEKLSHLRPAFENEQSLKIGQNMKFDLMVLSRYGIEVRGPRFDTMVAHFLLHPGVGHGMDAMAEELLHYKTIHITELIGSGTKQKSMVEVPMEQVAEYAAEDADVTLRLYQALEPQLSADAELSKIFREMEMPLVQVLTNMETAGVLLDTEALDQYATSLKERIAKCEEEIAQMSGERINLASPKQVGELLFGKMKLDPKAKKTKTGSYVTNEETLQKLANTHPIIDHILTHRGLVKLYGTYAEALPRLVNTATGRIHTSFNQTVVVTGRLSSSNPNLQNIPVRDDDGKRIRQCFVAQEGCQIVAADYSQVELRIMAHFSQDEHLLSAFRNGDDIHAATAAKIFGVELSEVTSDMRRKAKTANFGIIYGISAFGLAERLKIGRAEAKDIIDGYFCKFPGVKAYMDNCIAQARETGVVKTLYGRRRELPDINSRNAVVRGVAERNAINAPIQGTAADIIKMAMIGVSQAIEQRGLRAKMILQVHDELVFEVPNDEVEALSQLVKEQMESACTLSVPLTAEVGVGHNWLQAH